MKLTTKLLLLIILCTLPCQLLAELRLPNVFTDSMVLQADQPINVWGWAQINDTVTIKFASRSIAATADNTGKWTAQLPPMKPSPTPATLTVTSKISTEKLTVTDILIGQVWLCSGQSNMEMPLGRVDKSTYRGAEGFEEELAHANLPNIRLLQVTHAASALPVDDLPMQWEKCTPTSAYWFSAVAYAFGKKLHQNLNQPIGLINCSWGGSGLRRWMPPEDLKLYPDLFAAEIQKLDQAQKKYADMDHITPAQWRAMIFKNADQTPSPPSEAWLSRPPLPSSKYPPTGPASVLYNGMITPILPYTIKGVIWYQGETDLASGLDYQHKQIALIKSWRQKWNQGDFPFYIAQIAPFKYESWPVKNPPSDLLPKLWLGQMRSTEYKNTGIVPTTDLGELDNIHPIKKLQVGQRLANLALAKTYNHKNMIYSGPTLKSAKPQANKLILTFDHAKGLKSSTGNNLTFFEIAAEDKIFVKADATINNGKIILTAPGLTKPIHARFAWHQTANPNLTNEANLPAYPFNTAIK